MSFSPHAFFFSKNSLLGRKKHALLAENCVIAVKYSETEPMYRTSWEDLLKFGKIGPAVFAEAMRKAEGGAVPAGQLENEQADSFVLSFCVEVTQDLGKLFPEYEPKHGFDLDLAIIVGNVCDSRTVEVYCEVFPRSAEGQMVTDFASRIIDRYPLRVSEEEMGGPGVIVVPVMGLLLGEGGSRGEVPADLAQRVTQWCRVTRGVWPVSGEFLTGYFLNRSLSSIALSAGETVRTAHVHQGFDGDASGATLGTTRVI